MFDFLADTPPTDALKPGLYGSKTATPGVTATRPALALATLCAGRGQAAELAKRVKAACGAELPMHAAFAEAGGLGFIGIGPGRWTVVSQASQDADGEALEARLQDMSGDAGSVCDQSDSVVVFELSGPRLRDALAKLLQIDIDAAAFGPGAAATTCAATIGITLWQGDTEALHCTAALSYAEAFVRALAAAAAEYGFRLA